MALYAGKRCDIGRRRYDRVRALHAPDLIAWAAETQPKAWADLISKHGEAAVLDRVRKSLDERGTLEVLRRGVEFTGLKAPLILAQFRPAMGMSPEIMARYAAKQALESPATRNGLLEVLMGPGQLYEALREKAAASA